MNSWTLTRPFEDLDYAALTDDEYRTIVALYRLTKGRAGVQVFDFEVADELTKERVHEMSSKEFEAYRTKVVDEVAAWWRRVS